MAGMADRILLNIGGSRFETSRDTLLRVPGTLFYWFCTGRLTIELGDDGSIFFDRDPSHFKHILAFLQDGTLAVAGPTDRPSVGLLLYLRREFSYYGIRVTVPPLPSEALDYMRRRLPAYYDYRVAALVFTSQLPADLVEIVLSFDGPSVALILLSQVLDEGGDVDCDGRPLETSTTLVTSTIRVLHVKPPGWIAFAYCVVGSYALYMVGGIKRFVPGKHSGLSRQVDKFDIRSELWTTVALMPEALELHSAVAVGLDLYIIGGRTSQGQCSREVFVLATRTLIWSRAPPLPVGRWAAAACSVGQRTYVFGGRNDGGAVVESRIQLPQVYIFDTVANTWSMGEEMPIQPETWYRLSATVVGGQIFITGGPQRGVLRYDPTGTAGNSAWFHCPPSVLLLDGRLSQNHGLFPFAFNGRLILLTAGGVVAEYVPAGEYWSWESSFSVDGWHSHVGAAAVGEPITQEEEDAELFSSLISSAMRRDRVVRVADIDLTVDSDSDYTTEDSDEGES
jgi:hypothetical protein